MLVLCLPLFEPFSLLLDFQSKHIVCGRVLGFFDLLVSKTSALTEPMNILCGRVLLHTVISLLCELVVAIYM